MSENRCRKIRTISDLLRKCAESPDGECHGDITVDVALDQPVRFADLKKGLADAVGKLDRYYGWLDKDAARRTRRNVSRDYLLQRMVEVADYLGRKQDEEVSLHAVGAMTIQAFVETLQELAQPAHGRTQAREKKPRKSAAEYNVEARKYLQKHPLAGPRELQRALGCGMKTLYGLSAFEAVKEQRKKGRKPKKPRAVSLTPEVLATTADATDHEEELARLIEEQERDKRTRKVHSRERL